MPGAAVDADGFCVPDFCLIFAPLKGSDEPEILLSQLSQFCLVGADAGQRLGGDDSSDADVELRLVILE